ncbi:MAG: orotidine-5'-phosphate decarboxylase [Deltaproteobacteria bacterium]|nr:orotidine-5'-phosphate decarboxylase [Deltaproteobacteria bacterium]MBW2134006.1 orotidine-5'-phosphate decarboxylase [Deltaproteobacteria bacterium]
MEPKDRLIFPLDVSNREDALGWIEQLQDRVGLFKVGLELFVAEGLPFLQTMAAVFPRGYFLDLKFSDIPATLRAAQQQLFNNVSFFTVHCEQGQKLLRETIDSFQNGVKFLAVTVLTSLNPDDLLALGYDRQYSLNPTDLVLLRAQFAKEAGCSGVICSGREVKAVKERFGKDFLVVCPGIRPEWSTVPGDDQQRIVTPYEAIRAGADYIVVGRPIRLAANPVEAARRVVEEIEQALP